MLNSIIVKKTPTNQFVPVKNEIYLHSAYDPIKEAENFLDKHRKAISEKNDLLILGLGFGYHIDAIESFCKTLNKAPTITILEPDLELINLAGANRKISYKNIYSYVNIDDLFNNNKFVELLMRRPYLIPHGPSISSNEKYFKEFLTYQANKSLNDIANKINNPEVSASLKEIGSFEELEQTLTQKNKISATDFLLMSLINIETQGKNL